jgi:hypothetical protein
MKYFIIKYLKYYGLDKYILPQNILLVGSTNKSKIINKYNISEFYDDSHVNILDIYHNSHKLKNLKRLFKVFPEFHQDNSKFLNIIINK